jgi:hypothetical protein
MLPASASPRLISWRAAALLGFALLAPAALPAGGAERRLPEVRRRQSPADPLLAGSTVGLRCAPETRAPVLARLESDVPVRVLRRWLAPDGRLWLRVSSAAATGRPARGWLPG